MIIKQSGINLFKYALFKEIYKFKKKKEITEKKYKPEIYIYICHQLCKLYNINYYK